MNEHTVTSTKSKQIAIFHFLSPQEEVELFEIGPELLALDTMKDGEVVPEINQLMRVGKTRGERKLKSPPPEYDKIRFLTLESCQHPDNLPTLRREFFDNIAELQKHDLLDPQKNKHDKKTISAQLHWSHSTLNQNQISKMQKLLVV